MAQAPLVEKIEVSVVNVDVTVTDRQGNPVRGLTRDDFEIFEDGKPQLISNFYVVESGQAGLPVLHEDDRFRRKVRFPPERTMANTDCPPRKRTAVCNMRTADIQHGTR